MPEKDTQSAVTVPVWRLSGLTEPKLSNDLVC